MDRMNAAILEGLGKWEYKKTDMPKCDDNSVIIQTKASGICSTDVLRSMKTGFYHYPIIPGHEFCGTVVEKGKNITNIDIDDDVAVYPLIPCKSCKSCISGKYNLCDNYNFLGSRTHGGYAEYVKAPVENIIRIPKGVSFEEAALTEPLSVTLHGVRIGGVAETVTVMGLGPIGLLVAHWAKVFGAKNVIGIDRNEHRFKIAKELGVDHCIDTRNIDVLKTIYELTENNGTDVVFECSGNDELQSLGIMSAAKGAKIVILGNPNKDLIIEKEAYSRILRRELSILGSWSSMIWNKEWEYSLNSIKEKVVKPIKIITHGFHISESKQVFEDMYFKRFEFSKVEFYF